MKSKMLVLSLGLVLGLNSCKKEAEQHQTNHQMKNEIVKLERGEDSHTFAQPELAVVKHLSLNLNVNFEQRIVEGTAQYTIDRKSGDTIVFDVNDGLKVSKVVLDNGKETHFELGSEEPFKGQPLTVKINDDTKSLTIHYQSSPEAGALQWLNPQQTAGKKQPFLLSQGQAILTRTWIPIQDSPGIRITYDATIKVPKELMAVMSADGNPHELNPEGIYQFKMDQPIPPYLIAIAVGDVAYEKLGRNTGVYAEPSMLKASVYEFADMQKMVDEAEKLYGAYAWGVYDVIVLPPSFPFGGMENPKITFATPTIIAGDRSLVSLIAHELAHSWSGNLVTNSNWNDFWLNEGFTVYFERRIMEAIEGRPYSEMLAQLGRQDLQHDLEGLDAHDTHLKLTLESRDPDDGMTNIAYEKGYFFLRTIEELVGRPSFDKFVKDYFDHFKFKVIDTDTFIEYLNANLLNDYPNKIDLEAWIFSPGIPESSAKVSSDKFEKVEALLTAEANQALVEKTKDWTTHEWLHFVRHLPQDIGLEKMKALDELFGFTNSGNSEIAAAWYVIAVENGYESADQQIKSFLVKVGRRKFLTPIYTALKENGRLGFAKEIYKEARPNYHSVSTQTMDALLGVE